MFKNKKNIAMVKYDDWEKDFGFLHYILKIKQQLVWSMTIDIILSKPIINSDQPSLISDDDVTDATNTIVEKVNESISKTYKQFIIQKYFNDETQFLSYLIETVYYDTIAYAIGKNKDSIRLHKTASMERAQTKQRVIQKKEALEKKKPESKK